MLFTKCFSFSSLLYHLCEPVEHSSYILFLCDNLQTRVDPGKDIIYVNGNRLPKKLPPKVYLALNKPKGFVSFTEPQSAFSGFSDYVLQLNLYLMQSCYCRYICSSGEKEFRSVLDLFEDYLKAWVRRHCKFKSMVSAGQFYLELQL